MRVQGNVGSQKKSKVESKREYLNKKNIQSKML